MKAFARLLIFFGILWCLMGGYYFYLRYTPNNLQFKNYNKQQGTERVVATETSEKQKSLPARIIINDLRINVAIIPAKVENHIWETTHDGASYLVSSPIPGNEGNSIIYGHNWANLFGNLTKAIPGQTVEIVYADGSKKRFTIEYTSVVSPSESSILEESRDTRITLYTCTGFFDSKRFVAVAVLENQEPSFGRLLENN